jgi:hypothetical protein
MELKQRRYRQAQVYRGGKMVCGRAELLLRVDKRRVGLTRPERRYLVVRFMDSLDPRLQRELQRLRDRRGERARRFADAVDPITIKVDEGEEQVVLEVRVQAPHDPSRITTGELREVEFDVREVTTP